MRRLYVLMLVIFSLPVFGQYVPNSAQNFHFAPLYNPAFTGIENFLDVKAGFRYQWTNFNKDAPQFGNVSASFRIKQPLDLKMNALRPSRTDFSKLIPRRKLSIHGMGVNFFSESYGPVIRTGGGLHFALHMPVSEKVFISAGAGGMLENTRIDDSKLYWGSGFDDTDPVYQSIAQGRANDTRISTRAGLLLYTDNFYFGGTYYPYSKVLNSSDVAFTAPYYRAGIQAGFSVPLSEDFEMKPSVWGLMMTTNEWVIDYSAKFYMQDRVWFGITYRDVKSGVLGGGFNVSQMFSASYSYEFTLGKLRTFSGSTHELILAFRFKNLRQVNQRTW